jgi:CRISPR-associated protein Cas5t
MLGLKVTVPVACFRKGFAREFWETEVLPPPATCYGFLLSLVGERDRRRHVGVRVCPALLPRTRGWTDPPGRRDDRTPRWPERSAVLRTLWRVKKAPLGSPGNARPDYQELLTGVRLAIWIESAQEQGPTPSLEDRVALALDHPDRIDRSGGLSLGESTHLIDEVGRLPLEEPGPVQAYLLHDRGRLSLPVWVDHVGSAGTRYVRGTLEMSEPIAPPPERMPRIEPH